MADPIACCEEARKLMAQALAVQTRSPEDARAKFRLAIQGVDVFLDQVPQTERFQTLVSVMLHRSQSLLNLCVFDLCWGSYWHGPDMQQTGPEGENNALDMSAYAGRQARSCLLTAPSTFFALPHGDRRW